jgi:hypothetical protein
MLILSSCHKNTSPKYQIVVLVKKIGKPAYIPKKIEAIEINGHLAFRLDGIICYPDTTYPF